MGLFISTNEVAGALAMWAVRQSPYDVPDGLAPAIQDFCNNFPEDPDFPGFRRWESELELYNAVFAACTSLPLIAAWNHPKSGHTAEVVFTSRYGGPNPDDDFIDLYALASNVARTAWDDEDDAQGMAAPSGDETGTGSTVGNSPVGSADAPHPHSE